MRKVVDCINCDHKAQLHSAERKIEFKKEEFAVNEQFYKCLSCGEEFTTNETDTATMNQIYNQYRSKHNIPFPDEIIALRNFYNIPAASMSAILGMGTNGYSSYENGEIPTTALSNLIRSAFNKDVFRDFLTSAKDKIPNSVFNRAMSVINESTEISEGAEFEEYREFSFGSDIDADEYSGFRKPDISRIANVLTYAISNCVKEHNDRLKINKVLFYIDFSHYKDCARSITGLPYRAIQYGPAPTCYDSMIDQLKEMDVLESKWIKVGSKGVMREIFESKRSYDKNMFSDDENRSVESVVKKFRNTSSWDIVEVSHREPGWIDNQEQRKKISYQDYAFRLKAF